MRILALDTATPLASAAALEDGRLLAEGSRLAARGHAGHLLDTIREVLDRAGWSAATPELFVVTTGPGSFTGLRVGIGTIEGLALAAGRPACGVSTLAAMAEAAAPSAGVLLPILDAGRGEAFAGIYSGGEPPCLLAGERAIAPAGLPAWLAPYGGGGILAFGTGAVRWEEDLRHCTGVRILPEGAAAAPGAARLAARLLAGGLTPEDLPLAARYLRRADARLPGGAMPDED